jgi:hypothetical protein
MSLKFPYLTTTSTTSSAVATGAVAGAAAGAALCLASWLSPLAAADRPALALLGTLVALPLGAMCSRRADSLAQFRRSAMAALAAAVCAALVLTALEPSLAIRALAWFLPAALLGAAAAATRPAAAVSATLAWLALCGLPFCYDAMPNWVSLERWAVSGSPWLGFSHDALGGDPLRRSIIYFGRLSGLTDHPAAGFLSAGTLWIAAALALTIGAITHGPLRRYSQPPVAATKN